MAWYDRVPGIRRVTSALRRISGRPPQPPPEPPPRPVTQGVYELPSEPVQAAPPPTMAVPPAPVQEVPMAPTDTGVWQPIAQQEVPAQTPTERLYELQGDEWTMYDPDTFDPIQTDYLMTQDDWYREALQPADYLRSQYGWSDPNLSRPNIEILKQLEADGYFIDWDQWRETYDAYTGG